MSDKEPKFTGDEPSVNWLIHVLTENVGHNEWVEMTPKELEAHLSELPSSMRKNPYTMKVVTTPIPEGPNMVFDCSKQYVIACNNTDIRECIIGMAQRLEHFRSGYWRIKREQKEVIWNTPDVWPDQWHSATRRRRVIVDSGLLHYIGGTHFGYHDYDTDKWYVYANGNAIEHKVEYWRHPPIGPAKAPKYEDVEADVLTLRSAFEQEAPNTTHFAYMLLRDLTRGKSLDHEDVRGHMEDLRKAFNKTTPGSFPVSLLGEDDGTCQANTQG